MSRKPPEIVEVDRSQLEALRQRAQSHSLEADDYETIDHVHESSNNQPFPT